MLALIVLAGGGWWAQRNGVNVQRYKPVWLLRWEASAHGSSGSVLALDELSRRANGGELEPHQVQTIVAEALALQADASQPWDPAWGNLIAEARSAGQVNDADWAQYSYAGAKDAFTLHTRPRIRHGDPIPFEVRSAGQRLADRYPVWYRARDIRLEIGDAVVLPGSREGGSGLSLGSSGATGYAEQLSWNQRARLSPGEHEVRLTREVSLYESMQAIRINAPFTPPVKVFTHTVSDRFVLLPADRPSVEAVRLPADRADEPDARNGVRLIELKVESAPPRRGIFGGRQRSWVKVSFDFSGIEEAVSARLAVEDGEGVRHLLDYIAISPQSLSIHPLHRPRGGMITGGLSGQTADVYLMPIPGPAAQTIDITRYWGEIIAFKDVPVVRPAATGHSNPSSSGASLHATP